MFTWDEHIAFFLVLKIGLPNDLVINMMKIFICPLRKKYVEDEAREWNESRFDHDIYDIFREIYPKGQQDVVVNEVHFWPFRLKEQIHLFRPTYIRSEFLRYEENRLAGKEIKEGTINQKIELLNLINKVIKSEPSAYRILDHINPNYGKHGKGWRYLMISRGIDTYLLLCDSRDDYIIISQKIPKEFL